MRAVGTFCLDEKDVSRENKRRKKERLLGRAGEEGTKKGALGKGGGTIKPSTAGVEGGGRGKANTQHAIARQCHQSAHRIKVQHCPPYLQIKQVMQIQVG